MPLHPTFRNFYFYMFSNPYEFDALIFKLKFEFKKKKAALKSDFLLKTMK